MTNQTNSTTAQVVTTTLYTTNATSHTTTSLVTSSRGSLYSNGNSSSNDTFSNFSSTSSVTSIVDNITTNSSGPFSTTSLYDDANDTSTDIPLEISNPFGALLVFFSLVVVIGNIMVIVAVFREMYLRTVTNYFIVSLAIADVMVGGIVMPFSISNVMTNSVWFYGQAWCDMWRSLDVLASTASILNLCVISVDRYWAITDPIAYPSRMSNYKVCVLIALVWLCSALISFPAIVWWRAVPVSVNNRQCLFTEDSAYLIISSCVSFVIPTLIMMFVYCKIYRAALAQTEGIKSGSKVATDCPKSDSGEVMTLRIHRGGARLQDDYTPVTPPSGNFEHHSSDSESQLPFTPVHHHHHHIYNNNHNHNNIHTAQQQQQRATFITKKIRHFAISKKITKLAREQKAAKTIGIVVGVFIICWVPFFCANVLLGICPTSCITDPDILMPVFTWLGYINSGMNPIIYALSMRDFRRAFSKMIFCCPRYRNTRSKRYMYSHANSLSTSTFSVNYGDRCIAMKI